ncbi:MAG: barstar family protein [Myxococcota bacterium]
MIVSLVKIDAHNIEDWPSFHDEFDRVFVFPDFYGRNMGAWIDCMSSLDEPGDGLTGIHVEKGGVLTIEIEGVDHLRSKCPEQYDALIDCSAFVNWRRIEQGERPVLALSFHSPG